MSNTTQTMRFGLIGYPLSHSFSPAYFKEKFQNLGINASYLLFPMEQISSKEDLLALGVDGFNVTIPHKKRIMDFLDEIDPQAEMIGAVNCVKIVEGRLIGYNTDFLGFLVGLDQLLNETKVDRALILGTGGSAQAIKYALTQRSITHQMVSRSGGGIGYRDLEKSLVENHKLIINTTPLGMYPKVEEAPEFPYEYLTPKHFLYDLIYNPEKTLFLSQGILRGAQTINGLVMLIHQAEYSWKIWQNQAIE